MGNDAWWRRSERAARSQPDTVQDVARASGAPFESAEMSVRRSFVCLTVPSTTPRRAARSALTVRRSRAAVSCSRRKKRKSGSAASPVGLETVCEGPEVEGR